jgi:DNA mismatch repair ATPase MutS
MAEIEYGGIKLGGSKLLLIIPLVTTLGGGLWAGFEFYKDYMDMKEQIQSYVAPDLSEFDKSLAVLNEDMKIVKETVEVFKGEILIIRDGLNEQVDYMRDTKHDLREDLVRMEKILDKVENDIDKVEDEAQSLMDRTKSDARLMIDDANNRFNDKVSGMEGYVKRELQSLENRMNEKLTKALDNPLAN